MTVPVTLVTGNDPGLVSEAVGSLVDLLVDGGDRSLLVDEIGGEEHDVGSIVDAASTPPFLADRRIVVARGLGRFDTAALRPLIDHLADPLPTSVLVLAWEKAPEQKALPALPKALKDAVVQAGGDVVDTRPGTGKARTSWVDEHLRDAPVDLEPAARNLVVERLGEDVGRLGGVLNTLTTAFGAGARLSADDVEPFLGEPGSVPPWDLTDAIDKGDRALAIERLHRMLDAGDRHALQVMGILTRHYGQLLRLDGAEVANEKAAAELLGLKGSTFPAKKAMGQARALGPEKVRRAIGLLAEADLDLRGRRAWPDTLVLEVLVARLAFLSRR